MVEGNRNFKIFLSMSYPYGIPFPGRIIKGHSPGLVPEGFVHITIKGLYLSGVNGLRSRRGQGGDSLCFRRGLQIEIAGQLNRLIPLIGNMDLQILIEHFQVAAGPEGQYFLNIRIHDVAYFEHDKKWYKVKGVGFKMKNYQEPKLL